MSPAENKSTLIQSVMGTIISFSFSYDELHELAIQLENYICNLEIPEEE